MKNFAALSRRSVLAGAAAPLAFTGHAAATSSEPALTIQRLEWAGVRLRTNAIDLFIDASASDDPLAPLDPPASRSFALATHHHGDHLDLDYLKEQLGRRGYVVVHKEAAKLFDLRAVKLQLVDLYEPVFMSRGRGDFTAWCVPATDGFGDPQVSWIVDGGGRRIIHCGDTLWHGHWWKIARAFGPFDIAFLPINGARQPGGMISNAGQSMVMGPEQAAAAAAALSAQLAVPIHYGFSAPDYIEQDDVEKRFIAAAKKQSIPVKIMKPGETLTL